MFSICSVSFGIEVLVYLRCCGSPYIMCLAFSLLISLPWVPKEKLLSLLYR